MAYLNLDLDYFDHPKTKRLVGLLGRGATELPIRLWCYCGKYHAESGSLTNYSIQEIESIVSWWGKPGDMVSAMEKVGLLEKVDNGWQVKDWNEINGHLAMFKQRAMAAAKARWGSNASSNAQALVKQSPNRTNLTIPTKTPIVPFGEFWAVYPRKTAKAKAEQAWLKIAPEAGLFERMKAAIIAQKQSDQWRSDGGKYIPHPATWLNQARWEDEVSPGQKPEVDRDAMRRIWKKSFLCTCHGWKMEQVDDRWFCKETRVEMEWARGKAGAENADQV